MECDYAAILLIVNFPEFSEEIWMDRGRENERELADEERGYGRISE